MATRKTQSNETKLKKLIADNPPILNALLIDRIFKIMELTEEDIKENPQNWVRSIVHPSLYHDLNKNVQKYLSHNQ
jgi:hypothetical protein